MNNTRTPSEDKPEAMDEKKGKESTETNEPKRKKVAPIRTHHGYCMDGFVVADDDYPDAWGRCWECREQSEESDEEYEFIPVDRDEEEELGKEGKEEHDLDEELDEEDLELVWKHFKNGAATCNSGRKRKLGT